MWFKVKPEEEWKPLSKVIDVKKRYNFRPYSYTPRGVTPKLFYAQSSEEI